ncbi:MAG: hypothetical protein A2161_11130 [Candidatus Schekmanbacteria bacterium RBG_13_48_7]|uniref:Glycosyl transferase family 1 domain-containing protein n=1 Tax=Candidatus Schekmanbacteria bacterium RBG_13_48_7 TaxID=1817878 RepID=A0A1F7RSS4_9BACT|nr:MAG: hypothetical protein A2161_11130 [Candidatus Schekmanbacteria bacterium RBG_13_48_7]
MRILFVTPEYHQDGGTERSIYMLSHRISENNTVDIITSRFTHEPTSSLNIIKVPRIYGVMAARFLFFRFISDLLIFYRKLRYGFSYDIIHSTSADSGLANIVTAHFCMKKHYQLRKKSVSLLSVKDIHGFLREITLRCFMLIVSWLEKRCFNHRRTKRIIAVSNSLKNDLIHEYGVSPEKIDVIYDGVDPERFCPDDSNNIRKDKLTQLGIPLESIIVLFVGGDWERKGLIYLLKAFQNLQANNVHLLIVGKGDVNLYQALSADLNIFRSNIHFLPFDVRIEQWYNAADIFVLPSLYEPFGMVALEAMSCGLPVITTSRSGISEIIKNGYNGIVLHDPEHIDILTMTLRDLIENPDKREQLGKNARTSALKYTWQQITSETLSIYQETGKET